MRLECDYKYKCLKQGVITIKYSIPCPHLKNCGVFKLLQKRVSSMYHASSLKKNKKKWDHSNLKMQDVRDLFYESLNQGLECTYCRKQMCLEIGYLNSVSLDHITARGLGGSNSKENLVICCVECNRAKSLSEMKVSTERRKGEV